MGKKVIAAMAAVGALALPSAAQAVTGAHLSYGGGPIMPSVDNVVVQWGDPSAQPAGYLGFVDKYFADVAANSYATNDVFANDEQYQPPASEGQLLTHKQTFHGEYDITPGNRSSTLSETDIATELATQISAGHLPPPGPSTGYFVMFPASYTLTLQGTPATSSWCDYHYSAAYGNSGQQILFAVIPTWAVGTANYGGCGSTGDYLKNQTMNISHQQNEMITDPVNATGWYDSATGTGEIGDICNDQAATNTLNGTTYTIQKEWSNSAAACVSGVNGITGPTAAFSSSASNLTLNADASGSSSPSGIHSYDWSFGDGSTGSGVQTSHSYASPGTYTVTLEVTDNGGFLSKMTKSLTVSAPPAPAGSGGGGPGGGGSGVTTAAPTPQQILAALGQAAAAPQSARITPILSAGGFADPFTAPGPGAVVIQWFYLPPGAHLSRARKPLLVAQGSKVFAAAGRARIRLALTAAGRKLLRQAKKIHLTSRGIFTPRGGAAIKAQRTFTLRR